MSEVTDFFYGFSNTNHTDTLNPPTLTTFNKTRSCINYGCKINEADGEFCLKHECRITHISTHVLFCKIDTIIS